MASLLPEIPLRFMRPEMKYALMNWLVSTDLPARISNEILRQWGAELGVTITATDYDLVGSHLLTSNARNAPGDFKTS